LSPFMGAWLPNIFFGTIAVTVLIREHYIK